MDTAMTAYLLAVDPPEGPGDPVDLEGKPTVMGAHVAALLASLVCAVGLGLALVALY